MGEDQRARCRTGPGQLLGINPNAIPWLASESSERATDEKPGPRGDGVFQSGIGVPWGHASSRNRPFGKRKIPKDRHVHDRNKDEQRPPTAKARALHDPHYGDNTQNHWQRAQR